MKQVVMRLEEQLLLLPRFIYWRIIVTGECQNYPSAAPALGLFVCRTQSLLKGQKSAVLEEYIPV